VKRHLKSLNIRQAELIARELTDLREITVSRMIRRCRGNVKNRSARGEPPELRARNQSPRVLVARVITFYRRYYGARSRSRRVKVLIGANSCTGAAGTKAGMSNSLPTLEKQCEQYRELRPKYREISCYPNSSAPNGFFSPDAIQRNGTRINICHVSRVKAKR